MIPLPQTIIIISLIFSFLFGTVIGSFINVIIYRLKNNIKGILNGRSFCPNCKKEIKAYDLIPILSFFFLKGKCRNCSKKISSKYPLVEFLTGIVFLYIFWNTSINFIDPLKIGAYFIYSFILVTISVYDFYYKEIPTKLILSGIIIAFILSITSTFFPIFSPPLYTTLIAFLITFIFFGSQVYFSKERWMGWGDVFIGAFMAFILGWKLTLVAMFLSYILGSIVGVFLIIMFKHKGKTAIPFGPFLSLGTLIAMGYGNKILEWYLSLLI